MGMMSSSHTTVVPATAGYELLSLEADLELMRRPIVGWAVTMAGSVVTSTLPIALGGYDEGWHAIRLPDGRCVSAVSGTTRYYSDVDVWLALVKAPAAAEIWRAGGHLVAGEG